MAKHTQDISVPSPMLREPWIRGENFRTTGWEMYSKRLPSERDVAIALTNSAVFICRPARDRLASVHCAARAPLSPPYQGLLAKNGC